MTVLVLGGTAEARALAAELAREGRPVLTSLAGRVADPALPPGEVRIGALGGVAGLTELLRVRRVAALVDATHPFAATISTTALAAAERTGVPLLRLERPGWADHPRAGTWTWVPDAAAALAALGGASRPFLTTGRQTLEAFLPLADRTVLVRVVDPPAFPLPHAWTLVRSRGPYGIDAERELMTGHGVDTLVTKDSGGGHTAAKLEAAGELGVPVVIIRRPVLPPAPTVPDPAAALRWLEGRSGR